MTVIDLLFRNDCVPIDYWVQGARYNDTHQHRLQMNSQSLTKCIPNLSINVVA